MDYEAVSDEEMQLYNQHIADARTTAGKDWSGSHLSKAMVEAAKIHFPKRRSRKDWFNRNYSSLHPLQVKQNLAEAKYQRERTEESQEEVRQARREYKRARKLAQESWMSEKLDIIEREASTNPRLANEACQQVLDGYNGHHKNY